ncbi:MAG: diguanylate cyclase [Candidatus Atribacteria bacterium]|nr:diguanylate cyclase [Candidatus Atribacteria bacterium]
MKKYYGKKIVEIIPEEYRLIIGEIFLIGVFFLIASSSTLFFHSIMGIISLLIAYHIFFLGTNYLLLSSQPFIFSISVLLVVFVIIDFIRVFIFWRNPFLLRNSIDLTIQLWLVARFAECAIYFVGFLAWFKRYNFLYMGFIYLGSVLFLFCSSFLWNLFPLSYQPALGLTNFTLVSEYFISAYIYITLSILLFLKKKIPIPVLRPLIISFILSIGTEMVFTMLRDQCGFMIEWRVTVKFLSLLFIHQAVVQAIQNKNGKTHGTSYWWKHFKQNFKPQKDSDDSRLDQVSFSPENFDRPNYIQSLVDNAQDLIFRFRGLEPMKLEYINPAAERITGYTPEEFYSNPTLFFQRVYPEDRPLIDLYLKNPTALEKPLAIRMIRKDGSIIWMEHKYVPVYNRKKKTIAIEGIARDITERKKAEEQIRYISFHDPLTGLYNRAFFEEEVARQKFPENHPIGIILGDVNGIHLVNERFGHQEGDRILIDAANILKKFSRNQDILARWGEDEFILFLPNTNEDVTRSLVYQIQKELQNIEKNPFQLSISLGYAVKEDEQNSMNEVVNSAEGWMYWNKLIRGNELNQDLVPSIEQSLRKITHATEKHSERLQKIVHKIGLELELSQEELNYLDLLARLHDLGKIATPKEILNKSGLLSPKEWELVKRHPEIGYRIALNSPDLAPIAEAILSHHERWDGTGYPRGLQGNTIPLLSRIIAIADTYEVLTDGRTYKKPLSQKNALNEIKKSAGRQFDPHLVDIFIKVMGSKEKKE